ncbi:MAG: PAS domain-containing protein [Lachnospiraceae bacterium]|nr:PAS domain-containing protein [Lachnospiraceae bacterium]
MSEWQINKLRQLMEFGEKVFLYDETGDSPLLSVDDNFCKMLGFQRSELYIQCRGKAKELVYPPDYEDLYTDITQQIESAGEYTCRYRIRRRDGVLLWVWELGVVETDEKGRRIIRNLVVDISKQESIRKERDTTYDNIPGGVFTLLITENNFYIVEANKQYFAMLNTSREEYLGTSGRYTVPEDLPALRRHLVQQAAKRERIDFEFRSRRGVDKGLRWFQVVGQYYNEVEDGCEYLCILLDVTDRKKSILQLEQEKYRYRLVAGMKASLLFEYDTEQSRLQVYSGLQNSEYIPCLQDGLYLPWEKILTENQLLYEGDYDELNRFVEFDTSVSGELRLLAESTKTGERSYQWFELEITKIKKSEKTVKILGSIRNLDEKQKTERKNQKLQDVLKMQIGGIYEMILQINADIGMYEGMFTGEQDFRDVYPSSDFEDFVEQTAENFVHPDDRERFYLSMQLENMKEILNFSDVEGVALFRIRKGEGEYRYKCIRYSYIGKEQKNILVTAQDIHSMKEQQLKTEDANRKLLLGVLNEARESMEMRRNFSSMLAREIQAPIQHIYSWLCRQNAEDRENREMLGAASYVMKVAENIAEYEKIERGGIQFETREMALYEMFTKLFQSWQEKGKQQGITLTYNLNLQGSYYYGDSVRISQIINHVIGNCMMAASENGKIAVWGSDEEQGGGISKLTLIVEDWGIPVNELFFGRMYSVESDHDRSEWDSGRERMGTTFSLILARKLVELMGGRIELSRKDDKTNLTKLEIPLQKLRGSAEEVPRELSGGDWKPEPEVDLSGYSFLLVEKEGQQESVGSRLTLNGARVIMAGSGMEGIQLWNSYSIGAFDAVLVEGDVGDMDYLEFTECLREQKGTARTVPMFAIVEETYPDGLREGMKLGLNGVLGKPLELERLKQILDMIKNVGFRIF